EGVERLLAVDDLDQDREILGEAEDARGVDPAVGPEALEAAEDRGAGQALLARLLHHRLVERHPLIAVGVADEDPDQDAFALELHEPAYAQVTRRGWAAGYAGWGRWAGRVGPGCGASGCPAGGRRGPPGRSRSGWSRPPASPPGRPP